MNRNFNSLYVAFNFSIALATLAACSPQGPNGSPTSVTLSAVQSQATLQPDTPPTIHGSVIAGPVSGATVSIYSLNSDGSRAGSALATALTDAAGGFSFRSDLSGGTLEAVVSGGTYIEEANGAVIHLGVDQLNVILPDLKITSVSITPFTQIVAAGARALAAQQKIDIKLAVAQSSLLLKNALSGFDVQSPTDSPQYRLLLAGLSQLAIPLNANSLTLSKAISAGFPNLNLNTMIGGSANFVSNDLWSTGLLKAQNDFIKSPNNIWGLNGLHITIPIDITAPYRVGPTPVPVCGYMPVSESGGSMKQPIACPSPDPKIGCGVVLTLAQIPDSCNPSKACGQMITCQNGQLYPTICGPANCDKPIGPCLPPTTNSSCPIGCDPTYKCGDAVTCVNGLEYPTTCGPANCNAAIGKCPHLK